ncbi:hypothetical protein ANCCAN_15589 [Ancylostoma caninum]|uniref:Uncharacterized protein n=1 Tax=Ancylostoma caninum TaxID=29170 RepID=A0A368G746_ANCCA|nr:hypothetical protein ANCCAN_15589 [Ancylostoma caninum]
MTTESRTMTIKKIFRSPSMLASTSSDSLSSAQHVSPNGTPVRVRQLSPDSKAARELFTEFLVKSLPTSVLQEVTRQVKYAVMKIHEVDSLFPSGINFIMTY